MSKKVIVGSSNKPKLIKPTNLPNSPQKLLKQSHSSPSKLDTKIRDLPKDSSTLFNPGQNILNSLQPPTIYDFYSTLDRFSFKILKFLNTKENGNFVFSPYCIFLCSIISTCLSKGNAQAQLLDALELDRQTANSLDIDPYTIETSELIQQFSTFFHRDFDSNNPISPAFSRFWQYLKKQYKIKSSLSPLSFFQTKNYLVRLINQTMSNVYGTSDEKITVLVDSLDNDGNQFLKNSVVVKVVNFLKQEANLISFKEITDVWKNTNKVKKNMEISIPNLKIKSVQLPEPGSKSINSYVGKETNGVISNLIPSSSIPKQSFFLLTSVLTFKANWNIEFQESQTKGFKFFNFDGTDKVVPMMQMISKIQFHENDEFKLLELKFIHSKIGMILALPKLHDQKSIHSMVDKFSQQTISYFIYQMERKTVKIKIPLFRIEWGSSFKPLF